MLAAAGRAGMDEKFEGKEQKGNNKIADIFLSILSNSINESRISVRQIKWEELDHPANNPFVEFSIVYQHNDKEEGNPCQSNC